ncbi:hypothetical protein D3C79_886290 [compost metagenome]
MLPFTRIPISALPLASNLSTSPNELVRMILKLMPVLRRIMLTRSEAMPFKRPRLLKKAYGGKSSLTANVTVRALLNQVRSESVRRPRKSTSSQPSRPPQRYWTWESWQWLMPPNARSKIPASKALFPATAKATLTSGNPELWLMSNWLANCWLAR